MTLSLLIPGVGMGGSGGATAWVAGTLADRTNFLVGDWWQEEIFYRQQPITGYTTLVTDPGGTAVTSGTVTVYITKDGGTQAAIGGSATHEGQGVWSFDLTTVEMDAEVVSLTITHSGDGVSRHRTINTKG